MRRNRFFILSSACAALVVLTGCGGGGSATPPPPPVPDFGVSISPHSASAVLGNTTSAVRISVSPQNGFSNPVTIALQGIPQGVDAMPSSSFLVWASATVGTFPVTALETSSALSYRLVRLIRTRLY